MEQPEDFEPETDIPSFDDSLSTVESVFRLETEFPDFEDQTTTTSEELVTQNTISNPELDELQTPNVGYLSSSVNSSTFV